MDVSNEEEVNAGVDQAAAAFGSIVGAHIVLGTLLRHRSCKSQEAVLGCHIGRLER